MLTMFAEIFYGKFIELPDGFQSFRHGVLAPGRGITSAELNAFSLTSAIQRTRRNAEFGGGPLHGGLPCANSFESSVQIGWRPGGGARVEWRSQPYTLSSGNFVQGA